MRPAGAKLAVALGALGGCVSVLTGCVYVLGPKVPADWDSRLRATVPPCVVAIDCGPLRRGCWGNGVLVHSSRERGTYILTSDRVARAMAERGDGRVQFFDLVKGTKSELRATNFMPTNGQLLERAPEPARDTDTTPELALLKVETADLLPTARLEARSPETAPEPFFVATIYPERTPRLVTLSRRPGSAPGEVAATDAPVTAGNAGSGIFCAGGHLCGLVRTGDPDARRSVAVLGEPTLVAWLRDNDLTWISSDVVIDLRRVTAAEQAADPVALLALERETETTLADVREAAVAALGRLGGLDAVETERLVRKDPEPLVRRAALAAEIDARPEHGDALAAWLLSSAERRSFEIAIAAIGTRSAPLPRATAALWGIARSRDDVEARAWTGAALVRRGATLESLPAELRARVLETLLADVTPHPEDSGTIREVCERIARRAHASGVVFGEGLGDLERPATLAAGSETAARRIRAALGDGSPDVASVFNVHADQDGTRVSIELRRSFHGKDESP